MSKDKETECHPLMDLIKAICLHKSPSEDEIFQLSFHLVFTRIYLSCYVLSGLEGTSQVNLLMHLVPLINILYTGVDNISQNYIIFIPTAKNGSMPLFHM